MRRLEPPPTWQRFQHEPSMSGPDILFVFPPHQRGAEASRFHPYMGTASLQACLQEAGLAGEQFMLGGDATVEEAAIAIVSVEPGMVGFTCYDTNYPLVRQLAIALRKRSPAVTIVVGGPTPTTSDAFVMEDCAAIDACFRGEAEISLVQALTLPREHWIRIPGITYRAGADLVRTGRAEPITSGTVGRELDILPSPFVSGVVTDRWPVLSVRTSRGCPFACTYCSFAEVATRGLRRHSVERVLSDLRIVERLVRRRTSADGTTPLVPIEDDCFNADPRRAKELCRAIRREGIRVRLWADLRAPLADRELLALMADAGFSSVNFGLESAAPHVLKAVCKARDRGARGRGLKLEEAFLGHVRQAIQWAREVGLQAQVSIIQGLPGERAEDAEETMRLVESLDLDEYAHNELAIFPGTQLYAERREYGLDAVPSATGLPLQTTHAYDLNCVDLGPRSDAYWEGTKLSFEAAAVLFGLMEPLGTTLPSRLIVVPRVDSWSDADLAWLGSVTPINGAIVGRHDQSPSETAQASFLEAMSRGGVPARPFYYLCRDSHGNGHDTTEPSTTGCRLHHLSLYKPSHRVAPRFVHVPLEHLSAQETSRIPHEQLIVRLAGEPARDCEIAAEMSRATLTALLVERQAFVEDGCKWDTAPCPAASVRRLILTGDRRVHTCGSGPAVAEIGTDLAVIRERLQALADAVRRRRGCGTCSVDGWCACCPWPAPFSEEQYCELQRRQVVGAAVASAHLQVRKRWLPTRPMLTPRPSASPRATPAQ
jgi:radical SAM superfamily enzyme YgiQ (UPF0313 family)